ncbi:MAG: hypothetical protein ACFB9N_06235 [Geitlerinemataceae cyanobacterium]
MKLTRSKLSLLLSLPIVLPGCWLQSAESKVERSGSIVPRNRREQLIFEHFEALRNQQYDKAHQQIAWHALSADPGPPLEDFAEERSRNHSRLPTKISIGEEVKLNSPEDEPCDYTYTVYAAVSGKSTLFSGQVGLHLDPDRPNTCVIGYNSAFGN